MNILSITCEADADLSTKKNQLVKATADNGCDMAGAGEIVLGVLTNEPAADGAAAVQVYGVAKVKAGAAFGRGDLLKSDADGKAIELANGAGTKEQAFGMALEAAGAADELVDVLLRPTVSTTPV